MTQFRYTLEKYKGLKSRFVCPQCEQKNIFTRYIDIETGQYLNNDVGRCNREENCGYHYKPNEYFKENNISKPETTIKRIEKRPEPQASFIPLSETNNNYKSNHLYTFLINQFDKQRVNEVMKLYNIGSSNKWHKSTVFYQFDKYKKCRTGKIMQYNPNTGKRIKEPYNRISWIHTTYKAFNLKQCLFGEHLINYFDNTPIGIVESEKTALIMAIEQPEFIWLATGGLSNLSKAKLTGLGFRKIVLFPDSGCALKWKEKVKENAKIVVSEEFEKHPKGTDLADIILNRTS